MTGLKSVDWSFTSERTQDGPHGIHPYPAKFIPQIPRSLINLFPPAPGTAVLDPFCGSGTTLVEATAAGYDAVGIDLSPIACLIAKVKTTGLGPVGTEVVSSIVQHAQSVYREGVFELPDIPRVDHWFKQGVQAAISSLLVAVDAVGDEDVRDALRVALSSIIVRVSNQDSDTRYAAVEKDIEATEVFRIFAIRASDVISSLQSCPEDLFGHPRGDTTILRSDVLKVRPDQVAGPVGLVVTSPPYPNAYEYWLYHKYRMYWLGMDPIAVREKEIGARPHFFRTRDPHTAEHFLEQMAGVFALLEQVVIEGGHACFLIGRSVIRGETVDNLKLLIEAAEQHGFAIAETIERTIPKTRKAFNLSHASIAREHIAVFRRLA